MAEAEFDAVALDAAVTAAVGRCDLLTRADAEHFLAKGYLVVKGAFPRTFADAVRERAWTELADVHGIDRDEPRSWDKPLMGYAGMHGYVRTAGSKARFRLKDEAPRALAAQADVAGGIERLQHGERLLWSDNAIGNLGVPGVWEPPAARQSGWHKDGWHFRHFLGSPEQGLLVVPIFSDIAPQSGGTFVATDSVAPVARLLAAHPEGLHPDSVQGAGYLIPYLIEQCAEFEELTGEAGDMIIVHPFVLHRVSSNPSDRPRFIANHALVLTEPMRFDRGPDEACSLTELAVLRALGAERLAFAPTRPARAVKPGPFRDEAEAEQERDLLDTEMRAMAESGVVTPAWGPALGYGSNRTA